MNDTTHVRIFAIYADASPEHRNIKLAYFFKATDTDAHLAAHVLPHTWSGARVEPEWLAAEDVHPAHSPSSRRPLDESTIRIP